MRKNIFNSVHLEGLLYSHKLEEKVTKEGSKNPGTPYIKGSIDIATDDECLNIVSVYFGYTAQKYSSGKENLNYNMLKNIISGAYKNVMHDGAEAAARFSVDSAIALNEFYGRDNALVSQMRTESVITRLKPIGTFNEKESERNRFVMDTVVTNVKFVEGDDEKQTRDKVVVSGYGFGYKNALLPVSFVSYHPGAIDYFQNVEKPLMTKITGTQKNQTIVKTITEESAFGVPEVREIKSNVREFVITNASEPYTWDDDSSITADEFNKLKGEREIYLASLKTQAEESAPVTVPTATPKAASEFKF